MDSEYDVDSAAGSMDDRDGGLADFMIAFSLGALFGAGIALFLAPQSGEKTRKEMEKKSRKWRKQAEDLRESGGEWLGDAGERVDDWSSEIADVIEDGLKSIRSAVEQEIGKVEKKFGKKKGLFR